MIRRRTVIAAPLVLGTAAAVGAALVERADEVPGAGAAARPQKVLRYAFVAAETGFDPAQISDLYSRVVTTHLFEAPYHYDYLARPYKVVPCTAAAMPEVSADFRTWTIRIRPGIYFADDPAFKGKPRELVAADYVYAWKRFFDPANKSPSYAGFKEEGAIGVDALRQEAIKSGKPFDYDREVEGVRARRSLHARVQARAAAAALSLHDRRQQPVRRNGARGGRVLRRADRRASGRHRPVPARPVAAQLADRARAQPDLPAGPLRRRARRRRRRAARRCCASSRAGACR